MRLSLILMGLVLAAPCALAEPTRDAVMAGAERCAGIADNRVWLNCFYGSAQPMRSVLGLPPAPAAQVGLVPPPGAAYGAPMMSASATRAQETGGFFSGLLGTLKPVADDMPMASYSFERDGTFTVTLRNGQAFRQKSSDLVHAGWTRPAPTYLVTVTRDADGYILRVKNEPGIVYHARRL